LVLTADQINRVLTNSFLHFFVNKLAMVNLVAAALAMVTGFFTAIIPFITGTNVLLLIHFPNPRKNIFLTMAAINHPITTNITRTITQAVRYSAVIINAITASNMFDPDKMFVVPDTAHILSISIPLLVL